MCNKLACMTILVLIIGLVSNASATAPVGWWEFDEGIGSDANDSSGNGHHGTISGSVSWVPGYVGPYALDFAGGVVLIPDGLLGHLLRLLLGGHDEDTGTTALGTHMKQSQGVGQHPGVEDIFDGDIQPEMGVGIPQGVLVRFHPMHGGMLLCASRLVHVPLCHIGKDVATASGHSLRGRLADGHKGRLGMNGLILFLVGYCHNGVKQP